jgi:hypothetical protein
MYRNKRVILKAVINLKQKYSGCGDIYLVFQPLRRSWKISSSRPVWAT